jgi:Cell division protein FtsI/penicillin-binding protein 2
MNNAKTEKQRVPNAIKKRTAIACAFFILVCFGLVSRLAKLQIVDANYYQVQATVQQLRDEQLTPSRGTIYDSNMTMLAYSIDVWTIFIAPAEIKTDEDRELIISELSRILEIEPSVIAEKLERVNSYYEVLKYKVDKPIANLVKDFATEYNINGIYLQEDSRRFYPFGNFASTVIGFTGLDNQGLAGIEAYYNDELTGTAGRSVSARNAWGEEMPFESYLNYDAMNGHSLVLTIDSNIQYVLEENLNYAVQQHGVTGRGIGIVMDVNTGAILALAVKPDYDPNTPFVIYDESMAEYVNSVLDNPETLDVDEHAVAEQEALQLQWRNKAVSDLYEPGSVFKLVTASAALDSGSAYLGSSYVCRGAVEVADRTLRCASHEQGGHGTQNFSHALINSCNPAFITMATNMGPETFYDYFYAFGLTEKTGVDLLSEAQSQYYTAEQLGPVQLASSAFGQSNKITPLQMISAVCAVVNGGYVVRPHIVAQELDENGNVIWEADTSARRQVISSETSRQVVAIMEEAVSNGPCNNAYVAGYRVAGKSGTAQKLDVEGEDIWVASFVGVAPADNPRIAVLVILDEPHSNSIYGGVLCAPVAGAVIAETLPYLGIEPIYSQSETASADVNVPNITTLALDTAHVQLQKRGLTAQVIGEGNTVITQFPSSGQPIPRGSTVYLYTESSEYAMVAVPNFIGRTTSGTASLAGGARLNVKRTGATGMGAGIEVVSQSIPEGTMVPIGTVITLEYRNTTVRDDQ